MTATDLLDELKNELDILFADYTLQNKDGDLQHLRIFTQYTPQPSAITINDRASGLKNYTESDFEANFPCIIIQFIESTDNEERRLEMTTLNVRFLFGIYDKAPDCQGWRDILNMIEIVRQEFLTRRYLAEKFRLNMPVKSRLVDSDTWPVYFGEMDLVYETGRASMPAEFVHRRRG